MHIRIKYTRSKPGENNMRNIGRVARCNSWRVQVMDKNTYYAKSFADSDYENDWTKSAAAAKAWLDAANAAMAGREWLRENGQRKSPGRKISTIKLAAKAAKKN